MKNFGLDLFSIDPRAWVSGAKESAPMPSVPYVEDGNWEPFLPKYEAQADEFESWGCTLWAGQNQIETFYKRVYGTEPNYDEWFNYPLIPIKKGGQDPHVTCENIRTIGLVDAGTVKIPKTREEATNALRITNSVKLKGKQWLEDHDYKHEWLWNGFDNTGFKEKIKQNLVFSPIAVSVWAWDMDENGMYINRQTNKDLGLNNHFCLAYKVADYNGFKDCIHVFDTYDHSKKVLHPDHIILRAKRIHIVRKDKRGAKKQISVLEKILKALQLMKPTLLEVCEAHLGMDASPNDEAPDELGCANTVTALLKKVYPETPIITGTWTLWQYLKDPKNGFKPAVNYEPGTIIISPTGTGQGTGHVGIFLENGLIASNSSLPPNVGKFIQNYTLGTWQARYRDKQKMPIYLYQRA